MPDDGTRFGRETRRGAHACVSTQWEGRAWPDMDDALLGPRLLVDPKVEGVLALAHGDELQLVRPVPPVDDVRRAQVSAGGGQRATCSAQPQNVQRLRRAAVQSAAPPLYGVRGGAGQWTVRAAAVTEAKRRPNGARVGVAVAAALFSARCARPGPRHGHTGTRRE